MSQDPMMEKLFEFLDNPIIKHVQSFFQNTLQQMEYSDRSRESLTAQKSQQTLPDHNTNGTNNKYHRRIIQAEHTHKYKPKIGEQHSL